MTSPVLSRRAVLTATGLVFVGSAAIQLSSAISSTLFASYGTVGTSALRMLIAAALLLVLVRPRVRRRSRSEWLGIVGYGAAMAAMNVSLYAAVDRLPLGVAVTLEFLGPCAVALVAARRVREGACALLSLGGYFTDRPALRRNGRLGALGAASLGTVALVADLGRPERFLHMMRTVKPTSPMSLGSWLLAGFATNAGVAAAIEVDRMTDERLPLGPLRPVLHALELPTSVASGVLGAPLAAYTAVLLGDTAVPTWHEMHAHLPFVFVSSASLASGGFALVTTPVAETGPARFFAVAGVAGELAAMHVMKGAMDPVSVEPLEQGKPGAWLTWSERLSVIGGAGALLGGRRRCCLLYTSPSPRDATLSRMPSSA